MKDITSSNVLVSCAGSWILQGLNILLETIPHGKTAVNILGKGVDFFRARQFKLMLETISSYQPDNDLMYEKLVEAVSRNVTDTLREDIKSNNPDKKSTTWNKVSKWANKIGNEIKGTIKENGNC